VIDEVPGLRRDAALALQEVEAEFGALSPEARGERIRRRVIERADRIVKLEPGDLGALVLRARALYVDGRATEAAEELRKLAGRAAEDYRIPFLRALRAAEAALEAPVPLPALEAPAPEWDGPVPKGLGAVGRELQDLRVPDATAELRASYEADRAALRGLQALSEGRWEEAADALGEARRSAPLPAVVRGWTRAAYLARRFRDVRGAAADGAVRERVGAGLALAFESPQPAEALAALLKEAEGDAWGLAVVRAALARSDAGRDPGAHASAALEGLKGQPGPAAELAAGVEAARLRWRSLSAGDAEEDYLKALEALGDRPATWVGRLADVELRLGLGGRMLRRRREGRPWLEQAVQRAGDLAAPSGVWTAPVVLRAWARVRLDQLEEAVAELDDRLGRPGCGARAFLVAASARLRIAERKRREGLSGDEDVQKARELAAKALASAPEHPEGRVLAAAGLLAARGPEDVEALNEVVAEAARALERAPGYVEAAFLRGRALFFGGVAAARAGRDARSPYAAAEADFGAVLSAAPEFAPAWHARGVVRFKLERYDGALADWARLLELDPGYDTPDLRAHRRQAEDRRRSP
jgi:tetratricopeptide (TPR) repeat protein